MKTKIVLGILLPTVLTMLSCQKEAETPETQAQEGEQLEITATWAEGEADSRTALQADGTSIWWTPGDEINVFYGSAASGKFTSNNTEPLETATFQGTLSMDMGPQTDATFWAAYPYNGSNTCDGQSVTIAIPAEQTSVAGGFADKFFPAVATGKSTHLAFWNVCGGARFSVTERGIEKVIFASADGSPLCGKVKICFGSDGRPYIAAVEEGQASLTVLAPEGGFVPGAYYYAAMLPQKHAKGFELGFRRNGWSAALEIKNSITVSRSVFGTLNSIDSGLAFQPSDDPIVFADSRVKKDCVASFDINGDGEVSYAEAAAVTSLEGALTSKLYTSFDELRFFNSVTEIPDAWFKNRVRLQSIRFPEGLESIGAEAFSGCTALTALELPVSLGQIGASAFAGCTALSALELPVSLEQIGTSAFADCTALKDVTVDSFDAWIAIDFANAAAVPFGAATSGGHLYADGAEITAVTVQATDQLICFYNWAGLREISIPASVTSFSEDAFKGCTGLKKAILPSAAQWLEMRYANAEAAPFNASGEGHLYVNGVELTEYLIPEDVEGIAAWAFYHCTGLRRILMEPIFPPELGEKSLNGTIAKIFVWRECLAMYKSAWSDFANRIYPIPEDSEDEDIAYGEMADLGLSVKWATCNLGAVNPEDYGDYYAWGELETKTSYSWPNYIWCNGSSTSLIKYNTNSAYGIVDNLTQLEPQNDVVYVLSEGKWRMPTLDEAKELIKDCSWQRTTVNGVAVFRVTSKRAGYTNASIIIPIAGYYSGTNMTHRGNYGLYWTSSLAGPTGAYRFDFGGSVYSTRTDRSLGLTIRPVKDF